MYPAIAASRSPESLYIDTTSLISKYNSSNLYASTVFISPFTPPSRTPLRTVRQISLLSPQSLLPTLSVSSDHPQCPHKIRQGSTEPNARTQPGVDQCAYHIDTSVPPPPLVPDDLMTSTGDDLPGCVIERDQADLLRLWYYFHHVSCHACPSPFSRLSGFLDYVVPTACFLPEAYTTADAFCIICLISSGVFPAYESSWMMIVHSPFLIVSTTTYTTSLIFMHP